MTDSKRNNVTSRERVTGNEILNIGIGNCGIHMINAFYSIIMKEHKITKEGTFIADLKTNNDEILIHKSDVFFNQTSQHKYIPRAMFIDLDPNPIHKIQSSYWKHLLNDDHFIAGDVGPTMNFAKGHYTEGAEIIDNIIDPIRREIEVCDYFQGCNIMHSICGGTGGGLASLIALKIHDNYYDKEIFTYSVYPTNTTHHNHKTSYFYSHHNHNLEIYNSVLTFHQLLEDTDIHYVIDNDKLLDICRKQCKVLKPTYADMNWGLSLVLSGVTSTLRLNAEPTLVTNLRKARTYFALYPRLKNLQLTHSPFFSPIQNKKYNVMNTICASWEYDNDVSHVRTEDGRIYCCASIYRSNDEKAIDTMNHFESVQLMRMSDEIYIPHNMQSCYVYDGNDPFYDAYTPLITTNMINTQAIKTVYQRISAYFAKLYKRKAYLHWYKAEGMDEMEFQEADKNMRDLITEYQDKQGWEMTIDDYDDYDDDDDDYDEDDDDDDDDDDSDL